MRLPPLARKILLAFVCLLFLFLAYSGIGSGLEQVTQGKSVGRITQTIAEIANGFFALLSVITIFSSRRANRALLIGWTITATFAAGLAPTAWGGAPARIGIIAGAGGFLFAGGLAWLLRFTSRDLKT